jgi:phosphate uptake regulator
MVRELFASQIEALKMDVGVLGSYCENILELASQSLNDNSSLLAGEIKILDERIENKGREIENNCLTLLNKATTCGLRSTPHFCVFKNHS